MNMNYREDRTSKALDAALEMTFPASDPIAVSIYEDEPAVSRPELSPGDRHDERHRAEKGCALLVS
jgi:hypothetical protein